MGSDVGERSQFAANVLESMGSGAVAVAADGAVVVVNPAAGRILGLSEAERTRAIGRDCLAVLQGQPGVARLLMETLGGRAALSRAELELDAAPGQPPTAIGFTLSPVWTACGELCGAVVLFRDLTPIERGDEQERLRERLAALGQMAAGLAHELRNPLAGMEVVAGLLKRRLGDRPAERELVDDLLVALRSVADTVTSSLDFVRPLAGERAAVDVVAVVEEALALARSRLPLAVEVERSYARDLPALYAHADQLRSVVTDLVGNALEAMEAAKDDRGPRLWLSIGLREREAPVPRFAAGARAAPEAGSRREVVIGVADNGPGVPAELREKIFYPFFTTKARGSGVGLAAGQKVAIGHGGVLEFENRAEGGCHFRLLLPVDAGAEP